MTGHAVGSVGKATVIRLRSTEPGAGGLVTTFANTLAIVNRCRGPPCSPEAGVHMAGGALRCYRDIGVEHTRIPAGEATLVATVAIGNGHTT